jgi:hypothetical protein
MLWVMEGLWYVFYIYSGHTSFSLSFYRLAPKGTYKVQEMLQQGAWGCERGGYFGIFTPMYLMVARKP